MLLMLCITVGESWPIKGVSLTLDTVFWPGNCHILVFGSHTPSFQTQYKG